MPSSVFCHADRGGKLVGGQCICDRNLLAALADIDRVCVQALRTVRVLETFRTSREGLFSFRFLSTNLLFGRDPGMKFSRSSESSLFILKFAFNVCMAWPLADCRSC